MHFETLRLLVAEYSRPIQSAGVAAILLLFSFLARRADTLTVAGWQLSCYGLPIRILAVLFAAFMSAALIYNGMAIFADNWWVGPMFLVVFCAAWWLLYEVFVARLRWNDDGVEIRRIPFAPVFLAFDSIIRVRVWGSVEIVSIVGMDGRRLWFSYSYRPGMAELFARIKAQR